MKEFNGSTLTSNILAFGIVTLLFVVLRLSFRLHTRKTSASDWVLVVALVSSLCQDAFNAACVTQWGYGHHKHDIPPRLRSSPEPLKLLWLNQIFFKLTTLCTKLSICLLYHHIFKRATSPLVRATRRATYALIALIIGYYVPAFLVSIFECTPVTKSWRGAERGRCVNLNIFRFCTAAANILTSVLVIATPLPALSKMRHTTPEITGLMGLILLGVIHTACTIARLVLMVYPDPTTKSDPSWANIIPLTIAIVEMDIGIIAASLIVMLPFLVQLHGAVSKRYPSGFSYKGNQSGSTRSRDEKWRWTRGRSMGKAEVIGNGVELESQPTSVAREEVVPKDML